MRIDDPTQRANPLGLTQGVNLRKNVESMETSNSTEASKRIGFGKVLEQTHESRQVKSGDTLIGIVREQAQTKGLLLNGQQEYQWARSLADHNGIANPNKIFPGQNIQLGQLHAKLSEPGLASSKQSLPSPIPTSLALAQRSAHLSRDGNSVKMATNPNSSSSSTGPSLDPISVPQSTPSPNSTNPVLNQTLDRAVSRGFVPLGQRQDVYNKILQVAEKHQFSPDDFARLTLMESDGMNPVATNQRCHGIIQFCDGPARGAASVGWGQAPKSILRLSVFQQLHLVDTYFDKVGLKKDRPVSLDELYLAVLHPASRSEVRPEVPLGIPGKQARHLYEGQNPKAPMTRLSIAQGLVQNAIERLSGSVKPARIEAQNTQNYDALDPKRTWIR
jgi:hypothetical protein